MLSKPFFAAGEEEEAVLEKENGGSTPVRPREAGDRKRFVGAAAEDSAIPTPTSTSKVGMLRNRMRQAFAGSKK